MNYIATVYAIGGESKKRRKFAIGPIAANSKAHAATKALEMAGSDPTIGNYESLKCGDRNVRTTTRPVEP